MKNRLSNAVTTLVGPDTRITGNLLFGRGCHVAGLVQGDVLPADDKKTELTVVEGGRIEGNARSARMLIQGTVMGDLRCSGTVSLASSARVEGSIEYGDFEMEKGAVVSGSLKKITAAEPIKKASMLSMNRAQPENEDQVEAAIR